MNGVPSSQSDRLEPGAASDSVLDAVDALRAEMLASERDALGRHPRIHPENSVSARNLSHYLALRRHDLRGLQSRLRELGLATLARTEGHVLSSVDAVRRALRGLLGRTPPDASPGEAPISMAEADAGLARPAAALFRPRPSPRRSPGAVTPTAGAG